MTSGSGFTVIEPLVIAAGGGQGPDAGVEE